MSTRESSHRRPLAAFHLVLLGASAGTVAGALWSWHEIDLQRYLEHGFRRTSAFLADAQVRRGCLFGAVLGIWFAGLWIGARALWKDPVAWLRPREVRWAWNAARRRPSALAFPLLVTLIALGVLVVARGSLLPVHFGGALLALAVWWLVIGIELAHGRLRPKAHLLALWAAVPAFLLLAERRAVYAAAGVERYPGDMTVVGAGAAFGLLALVALGGRGLPRWVRWMLPAAELPLLGALALALGAAHVPRALGPERPVNVLIVGIDTLRWDHTSLAAEPHRGRDPTPRLAELARAGTVFENAISQAPWTMPAFASIFTGRYPHEHAAVSITGILRKQELTLAEILREAGYRTGSIVSHYFVNNTHGFGQGYDHFSRDYVLGEYEITSAGITDQALEWIDAREDEPFFLFLHYFDPHYEYRDHADSDWAEGYDGWVRDEMHIDGLRHKRHLMAGEDIAYLRDLYDEEIRHTDAHIGRVLDHLAERGIAEDTLVIVVSDHGEEFLERGWFGHSISLSEDVLHVPLVVVPARPEHPPVPRVTRPVETRAIFSTVLDAAGIEWDASVLHRSLLPLSSGERADDPESPTSRAFSSVWTPDAKPEWGKRALLSSVRSGRHKLVRDELLKSEVLYDLAADPGETTDAAAAQPEVAAQLREELDVWLERMHDALRSIPQRGAVAGEMAAQLKALGYM